MNTPFLRFLSLHFPALGFCALAVSGNTVDVWWPPEGQSTSSAYVGIQEVCFHNNEPYALAVSHERSSLLKFDQTGALETIAEFDRPFSSM